MDYMKNILVKHLAGSHAYGTNTPDSDVDYRGLFYSSANDFFSPFSTQGEVSDKSEEDTKFYELRKFLSLYTKCNPNIVETLWVDPSDVVYKTNIYDELLKYRKELLCSKVAFTYTGYAASQFSKMKLRHEWHQKRVDKPQQVDFLSISLDLFGVNKTRFSLRNYLHGYRLIPLKDNTYGLYEEIGYTCWNTHDGSLKKENPSQEFFNNSKSLLNILHDFNEYNFYYKKKLPLLILKFNKKEYEDQMNNYHSLQNWEANRNQKRHDWEVKFGYDVKNALHLVRLMRTGEEILKTGEVQVKRPDASELLEIKNGKMTYEELEIFFKEKDAYIRNVLYKETDLPRDMNIELANEISYSMHKIILDGKVKDTTGI